MTAADAAIDSGDRLLVAAQVEAVRRSCGLHVLPLAGLLPASSRRGPQWPAPSE